MLVVEDNTLCRNRAFEENATTHCATEGSYVRNSDKIELIKRRG